MDEIDEPYGTFGNQKPNSARLLRVLAFRYLRRREPGAGAVVLERAASRFVFSSPGVQ